MPLPCVGRGPETRHERATARERTTEGSCSQRAPKLRSQRAPKLRALSAFALLAFSRATRCEEVSGGAGSGKVSQQRFDFVDVEGLLQLAAGEVSQELLSALRESAAGHEHEARQ